MLEIKISSGEEGEKEGILSRRPHITILKMKNILRSQAACRSNVETSGVCAYIFLGSVSLLIVFQFHLFTKAAQEKPRHCFRDAAPILAQRTELFQPRWALCCH